MIPLLHTPEGVRDIYGEELNEMERLTASLKETMKRFGFDGIRTPSFEYFDVFSSERGTVPSKDMYKFIDRDGNTLVLRPDMTPQVARAAATYYREGQNPIRLSYIGNTFINNSGYQLRLKETTQAGVELFGDDSIVADAEILALTVECLKNAGLTEFQIEVGNAGFFRSIANECGLSVDDEVFDFDAEKGTQILLCPCGKVSGESFPPIFHISSCFPAKRERITDPIRYTSPVSARCGSTR